MSKEGYMVDRHTRRAALAALFGLSVLAAAGPVHAANQTVRVGIMSAEDEDVWAAVKTRAAEQGLDLKLVVFNDYTQPNEALENGELDANAFQHKPYLDNQIKTRGYHIVPVGYTAVWPIGLYSRKHVSVAALPKGAVIGIPNDPATRDAHCGCWTRWTHMQVAADRCGGADGQVLMNVVGKPDMTTSMLGSARKSSKLAVVLRTRSDPDTQLSTRRAE